MKLMTKEIEDMLVGAFEGGSNYWIREIDFIKPKDSDLYQHSFKLHGEEKVVYKHVQYPMSVGGAVKIIIREDDGTAGEIVILDIGAIKKGIAVMAEKYPRHYGDMLGDNHDADTADVFLQCCVFGEIVFG